MTLRTYVVTDLWADNFGNRPYTSLLRTVNDKDATYGDVIRQAIEDAGAVDGDEILILAVKTDKRPFADRRVYLDEPHTYRREGVSESLRRRANERRR